MLLSLGAVLLFAALVIWKLESLIYADRLSAAEAQMRSQINALQVSSKLEINALQRLVFGIPQLSKEKIPWSQLQGISGLLLLDDSKEPGNFSIDQMFLAENSAVESLGKGEILKSIHDSWQSAQSADPGSSLLWIWPDAQKNMWLSLLFPTGQSHKWIAMLGAPGLLQIQLDQKKGGLDSFVLLTKNGRILAHSDSSYLGFDLKDHPVLIDLQSSGDRAGSGQYVLTGNNQVLAFYEAVPHSNFYVIVYQSMEDILRGKTNLILQMFLLAGGILLILFALLSWTADPKENEIIRAPIPQEALKASMSHQLEKNLDQIDVYKKMAAALGNELRGTSANLLGYVQVIMSKVQDIELKNKLEFMLKEVKSLRAVVEKLLSFAGEKGSEKKDQTLNSIVTFVLKKLEPILVAKKIKVHLDFTETKEFPIMQQPLQMAIENIIQNSIEAMERLPRKELNLSIVDKNGIVELVIKDNGEGIESNQVKQIFDPFFTTRNYASHMGLGLAVAAAVVREHKGEIFVESKRGLGTSIRIQFFRQLENQQEEKREVLKMVSDSTEQNLSEITAIAQTSPAPRPQSPLAPPDLDVEKLLALPEEDEHLPTVDEGSIKIETLVRPKMQPLETKEDLDAFKTIVLDEAQNLRMNQVALKLSNSQQDAPQAIAALETETQKPNLSNSNSRKIEKPNFIRPQLMAELDSYVVGIPKPEKRD